MDAATAWSSGARRNRTLGKMARPGRAHVDRGKVRLPWSSGPSARRLSPLATPSFREKPVRSTAQPHSPKSVNAARSRWATPRGGAGFSDRHHGRLSVPRFLEMHVASGCRGEGKDLTCASKLSSHRTGGVLILPGLPCRLRDNPGVVPGDVEVRVDATSPVVWSGGGKPLFPKVAGLTCLSGPGAWHRRIVCTAPTHCVPRDASIPSRGGGASPMTQRFMGSHHVAGNIYGIRPNPARTLRSSGRSSHG